MDWDWEYIYFCEHEIPGYPSPGSCGEPAVARVWWDVPGIGVTDTEEMYVCQEHLDFITECKTKENSYE